MTGPQGSGVRALLRRRVCETADLRPYYFPFRVKLKTAAPVVQARARVVVALGQARAFQCRVWPPAPSRQVVVVAQVQAQAWAVAAPAQATLAASQKKKWPGVHSRGAKVGPCGQRTQRLSWPLRCILKVLVAVYTE